MNFQEVLYNEHFYRKLALAVAIIRARPTNVTAKEFVRELQDNLRRKRVHQLVGNEQMKETIRCLSNSVSAVVVPQRSIDLLKIYGTFLEKLSTIHFDLTIEIQSILIDTSQRVLELMKENLHEAKTEEKLFEKLLDLVLIYDPLPSVRDQIIEYLIKFVDRIFFSMKRSNPIEFLLEHIARHPAFFFFILERLINEVKSFYETFFDSFSYGERLIAVLERLISHGNRQITENHSILSVYQALLYVSLLENQSKLDLTIRLWNLYGRFLEQ